MRHRLPRLVLICWLAMAGLPAVLAAEQTDVQPCAPDTLEQLESARLGPPQDRPAVAAVASACKLWPYDESILLATAVFGDPGQTPGERRLYGVVAMVSTADGTVQASHHEEIEEDASVLVMEDDYRLDTARYDLADGVRAFGVAFDNSAPGPSCPEGGFNDQLTLFVREGTRLRPVLSVYRDEWITIRGDVCSRPQRSVVDRGRTVLQIEPTRTHGWADITLSTRVEREVDAQEPYYRRTARRTLHFNGTLYQLDPGESLYSWDTSEPIDD